MNVIEIFGYADQEICAGCEGPCSGSGADGQGHGCSPGAKKRTDALVTEFRQLFGKTDIPGEIRFYEATPENLERHGDVKNILSMADLAPAIVFNGKLLFLGGFSPAGLIEEIRRRI